MTAKKNSKARARARNARALLAQSLTTPVPIAQAPIAPYITLGNVLGITPVSNPQTPVTLGITPTIAHKQVDFDFPKINLKSHQIDFTIVFSSNTSFDSIIWQSHMVIAHTPATPLKERKAGSASREGANAYARVHMTNSTLQVWYTGIRP